MLDFEHYRPKEWEGRYTSPESIDVFIDQQQEISYQKHLKEWQKAAAVRLMPNAKSLIKEFYLKKQELRHHLETELEYKRKYALPFTINSAYNPFYSSYQLAVGHWMPAKMSPVLCCPRPESEIQAAITAGETLIARQQFFYADGVFEFRLKISIQGGAYPFYEDTSTRSGWPSWLNLDSNVYTSGTTKNPDYLVFRGVPPVGDTNTYNISTTIYDQDNTAIPVSFTTTGDNTKFIYIDPNAATNGTTGTITDPYNTMIGISVVTGTSPYAGKMLVFRGGSTPLHGTSTTADYHMDMTYQNPNIFLGYSGDLGLATPPTLDFSTNCIKNFGQADPYIGGLSLANANPAGRSLSGETAVCMYYEFPSTNTDRAIFFENDISNLIALTGTGASSNQSAIMLWNQTPYRKYVTISNNTIDNFTTGFVNLFATQYFVSEHNTILGSGQTSSNGSWYVKNNYDHVSVRANDSLTHANCIRLEDENNNTSPGTGNIEICWNVFLDNSWSFSVSDRQINFGFGPNPTTMTSSPRWIYRNSIYGVVLYYDQYVFQAYLENNVYVCGITPFDLADVSSGTYVTVSFPDITGGASNGNLYGISSDGFMDTTTGLLTGSGTAYNGLVGAFIS